MIPSWIRFFPQEPDSQYSQTPAVTVPKTHTFGKLQSALFYQMHGEVVKENGKNPAVQTCRVQETFVNVKR